MSKKTLLVEAEAHAAAGSCSWRQGAGKAAVSGWLGAHASAHHVLPGSSDLGGHPGSAPGTVPYAQPCALPISSAHPSNPRKAVLSIIPILQMVKLRLKNGKC